MWIVTLPMWALKLLFIYLFIYWVCTNQHKTHRNTSKILQIKITLSPVKSILYAFNTSFLYTFVELIGLTDWKMSWVLGIWCPEKKLWSRRPVSTYLMWTGSYICDFMWESVTNCKHWFFVETYSATNCKNGFLSCNRINCNVIFWQKKICFPANNVKVKISVK